MGRKPEPELRERILRVATDAFRRRGFDATSVDDLCQAAGVSKGAFFHHFESKQAVAEACLALWNQNTAKIAEMAAGLPADDPVERLLLLLERFTEMLSAPGAGPASCLAGTIAQEVAETNPRLREAAQNCFASAEVFFASQIAAAADARGLALNASSLARLWMSALQGALILAKASGDLRVLPEALEHVREYIRLQLEARARAP